MKIKNTIQYTVDYCITSDGWYLGRCRELRGALTQGKSFDELMENMKEAIALSLECKGESCADFDLNPVQLAEEEWSR